MIVNLARLGKNGTGMWQYSIKFLDCLNDIGKLDAIICPKMHEDFLKKYSCTIITVPDFVSNTTQVSKLRPILWMLYSYFLSLKLFLKFKGLDIVSTTHHYLPFISNQIITIHDLRPYFYPDSFLQKLLFRVLMRKKIHNFKNIITVSNVVKIKICEVYKVNENKVSVVYNSINCKDFIFSYDKDKYLLAVGCNWKHKNIHQLIENYNVWAEQYSLRIVCAKTEYTNYLKELTTSLNLNNKVEFLHNVPFEDLKMLYSKASALIYPSIDEGFGIPPIESMASLTPVIVSDIPVFREVLKDKAIYVNPSLESSWQNAFFKLSKIKKSDLDSLRKYALFYDMNKMKNMVLQFHNKL